MTAALRLNPMTATEAELRAEIIRLRAIAGRLEAYLHAEFSTVATASTGGGAVDVSNVTGHRAGWSVSSSTYSTGGCRCDGCTLAMRRAVDEAGLTPAARPVRKPPRNVPPPQHTAVHGSAADTWPGRA